MKPLLLSRIRLSNPRFVTFFSLTALVLSLLAFSQTARAQNAQLSLADILIGLRSKKATLPERNQILADAVLTRGVTFSLTPEIETELKTTGASTELVEAIRQKSVKIVAAVVPKATPVPTPIPTPVATPVPTPDFAFYRKRADENNFKGEFDLALNDYSEALKLNPKDNLSYLNRGRAFSAKKNYDSAIADYDKAIEIDPKDAKAYFNRGDTYEKKGDVPRAIVDYQKAVEFDATNEVAKNNLKRLQAAEEAKKLAEAAKPAPETKKPETVAAVVEPPKTDAAFDPTKPVELGQLNKLAVRLVTPVYPQMAKQLNLQGTVVVQVALDEEGKVISAKATSGNQMLRAPCEQAVRNTKFKPATVGERAVKATGFITYNFVNQM